MLRKYLGFRPSGRRVEDAEMSSNEQNGWMKALIRVFEARFMIEEKRGPGDRLEADQ